MEELERRLQDAETRTHIRDEKVERRDAEILPGRNFANRNEQTKTQRHESAKS